MGNNNITRRKNMPIVRLPGGALRDEIREPIFDTIDLTAGAVAEGQRTFFQDISAKGLSLTNLRQSKQLETAVSFRIQGMAIDVQNFRDANVLVAPLLFEHSSAQLIVGEKIYWEGPFRFVAGRMWTDLAASGGANIYQQHGFSAVATVVLTGKHVIDVNPLQRFQVNWGLEGMTAAELAEATIAADTKLRYVCSLKGLKRRPVQ
jgi:hypothetical protein